MKNRTIIVYGDSILKGVIWDENKNRYTFSKVLDSAYFENVAPVRVQNKAKFGCTIEKGYSIMEKTLATEKPDVAVIEFGGNDCDYAWAAVSEAPEREHIPNTAFPKFKELYEGMVQSVKAQGIRPVLLTLPPLDAARYFKWICRDGLSAKRILQFLGDVGHIYRWQELYSNFVAELARRTDSLLIDIRSRFLEERHIGNLLCIDGIHPNERGQTIIRDTLAAHLV